eukprot:Gb_22996 [translate_table: standard]
MALARPLKHQKKMMVFFVGLVLPSHATKRININCSALQTEELLHARVHVNANNSSRSDLRLLCKQGRLKEAFQILYLMDQTGVCADSSTYASLLKVCIDKKSLPEGKLVHTHMMDRGFVPDMFLGNTLINMYAKCGSLVDARRILDQMHERNVVSWTVMIAAYAKQGRAEEALTLFYEMQQTGIQPNQFTFSSLLPACGNLAVLKEVHEEIITGGFESNVFVASALVDMYGKCGSLENARHMFDKMPERNVVSWTAMITGYAQNGHIDESLELFQQMPIKDVVSWTAMIAGYAQNGHFDEALRFFRQMRLMGMKPSADTFASVLSACANLAALEQGKEVHEEIIRRGFHFDVFVRNGLVDMYAKCGSIENAWTVFDKMPKRDVVSWNAMIVGYAMHGCGKEALQLFEQMQHTGMNPNYITFVGVLSACCHAGLVDDGWRYYDSMSRYYQITPGMEHYCCMVDLLGRAGHLEEAQDFINKMPIKPDAAVWAALLGACRIHNNLELGECAAERLIELDPKILAPYVLLSNIYAAAGRWDDIEKLKQKMNDKSLSKKPGCSWIEINKEIYVFLVGDKSHPQTQEIYAKLESLSGQMKDVGYVPDTRLVLNDLEEEQKENILCHHSEKLAIACGLINSPLQTSIRIIKNLRVCSDCHSAIKFISKIVAREIVVRDANRFHHFKDGHCSCQDYW